MAKAKAGDDSARDEQRDGLVLDMASKDRDSFSASEDPALQQLTRGYLESLRNIFEAAKVVVPHLAKWLREEMERTSEKIERYFPEGQEAEKIVFENARDMVEFTSAYSRWERLQEDKSLPILLRSLFVQVFCEFDAFMGQLLKEIYVKNPDLLKGISREISLVDLLEYKDIESASKAMLEKEIESIRRDSYIEQFSQLEKKFSISLRKFPEWGQLVEFSQRRNVLVHNGGMVSEQYLTVCRREGFQLEEGLVVGSQLTVEPRDIPHVLRVMSKIGFMLTHTLWAKIFPKEIERVQKSMGDILYECLQDKRWKVASDLGEFSLTDAMKKHASEVELRLRIINTAIARKFSGEEGRVRELIESQDWSASYRDFKLAILVLSDRFDEAIGLMREIGRSGELLDQHGYHAWPLFEKFREREDFYAIYEEIYGEPYKSESNDVKAEMASDVKSKKKSKAVRSSGSRGNPRKKVP